MQFSQVSFLKEMFMVFFFFLYIQISRQRDSSWLKLLLIHVLLISTVHLISIINVQTAVGTG